MLLLGILIYFADCRTDERHASITRTLSAFASPPRSLLPSPDTHSFSAFYRMCEHNNFLRLSLTLRQKWIFMMMECRMGR